MAERGEKMDEGEIKTLVAAEIQAAVTFDSTNLQGDRVKALEYNRGYMADTPSLPGRSSVVSRDVADTIGWIVPGIIRVFTASDRMVEYEPARPNDEEGAKQATDYINYVFWKDNPGYRILRDATQDALLLGNGIVKHYWDDSEECEYSEHSGLTEDQIALLIEDGAEITAQKKGEPQKVAVPDPQTQQMTEIELPTFDVKVKRVTSSGRICIECIARENFLMDANAITIEDARFTGHRDQVSRSKLVEMGFDRETVDELPAFNSTLLRQQENQARDDTTTNFPGVGDESTTLIELYECYVRCDVDGDGVSETVRAYYAGSGGAGELLDWEVWDDDVPFSDIPCEPVPHRFDARAVSDKTMDTQRIKTVLFRQLLDNFYASNLPMREVEENSIINPEMLAAPKFGGVVIRKKGSAASQPYEIPMVAAQAFQALEYMDQVTEKRTGVSRATMALDPETLQNQTATANQNQHDAAYSQIELIARDMAELGWRRVFRQMLRLIVKHQDRPRTIRLRDEWVEMDPRQWNANMDATINVGLGTGSRDRDMSMLNNTQKTQIGVAQIFREAGAIDKAISMIPMIIKTAVQIGESAGIKNPDQYYPVVSEQDVQAMTQQAMQRAAQPDPKLQADIERGKSQLAMDHEKNQASLQDQQMKGAAQMQMDRQRAADELTLQREKMTVEMGLKREQIAAEMDLKREQLAAELQLKRELSIYEIQHRAATDVYKADVGAATSQVHPGGEPG